MKLQKYKDREEVEVDIENLRALHDLGFSVRAIEYKTGIPKSTVSRLLNK